MKVLKSKHSNKKCALKTKNQNKQKYTMATTISVRILLNKDVLLSWTLLDIFKDIYSVHDLFNDIKNGEFSHVQLSQKVCGNLLVAGCKTSTSHKLLEKINGSPFSNVVQKAKLFGSFILLTLSSTLTTLSCVGKI